MKASTKNLLLVDDDLRAMREFENWLRREGYDVHWAGTCAEAARVIENTGPEYAVVDLMLPDGSGLDVVRHLKEAVNESRIVLVTGFASIRTAVEAMQLGAADVLLKPLQPEELAAALDPTRTCEPKMMSELPTLDRIQWDYVQRVLSYCGGNISETARRLGIHRQSLQRMLRRHPPRH